MKHLGLIGAILPIVIIGIALIGWVLTVRNDVTAAVNQLNEIHEEIAAINEQIEGDRTIRTNLHIEQSEDLVDITNDINERINDAEKSLAIANDQMQTIMGDHMGFAEVLKELGEAGILPSGERRAYGGYGGN
jgi:uncharacterized protein YoxC